MLNFIRVALIGLAALFLSACTTIESKRGFTVKTFGYEFTCVNEPSQTVVDKDVVKALIATVGSSVGLPSTSGQSDGRKEQQAIERKIDSFSRNFAEAIMGETTSLIQHCQSLIQGDLIESGEPKPVERDAKNPWRNKNRE